MAPGVTDDVGAGVTPEGADVTPGRKVLVGGVVLGAADSPGDGEGVCISLRVAEPSPGEIGALAHRRGRQREKATTAFFRVLG